MSSSDLPLKFASEPSVAPTGAQPWKILVADDEEEIHRVTKLALSHLDFFGRSVEILDAYSGSEAVQMMRERDDIALILMDVVMENDQAGLDAVNQIRTELKNKLVRIVLRTGQPGVAPEREAIKNYDINDYKAKTELTSGKLFTVLHTGLSQYRELIALQDNKDGLRDVVDASASIFKLRSLEHFSAGVLKELSALLYGNAGGTAIKADGLLLSASEPGGALNTVAGIGRHLYRVGTPLTEIADPAVRELIEVVQKNQESVFGDQHFVGHFVTRANTENILYLSADAPLTVADPILIDLFCRNVSIAIENLHLQGDRDRTQRELVLTLVEAIESRSKESGNHVRRVAEYCRELAKLYGLNDDDSLMLYLAAPLHDAGKIAIPDTILNKPGRHTSDEFEVMQSHALIGQTIFEARNMPVLTAAGIIAGQHHERWDGGGYPAGLKGEKIHIFGRVTALADVFDSLVSRRCYKEPWPLEKAVAYISAESGKQFDPKLVELFVNNLPKFLAIRDELADPEPEIADLAASPARH